MDERDSSWVRRAKFSQTVCHRLDAANLLSFSLLLRPESSQQLKPKRTRERLASISLPADRDAAPTATRSISHSTSLPSLRGLVPSSHDGSKTNKPSLHISIPSHPEQETKKRVTNSASESSSAFIKKDRKPNLKLSLSSLDFSSFSLHPDRETKASPKKFGFGSSAFSSPRDQKPWLKTRGSISGPLSFSRPSVNTQLDSSSQKSGLSHRNGHNIKPKQRSFSVISTTIISDSFKEAKANKKRFSTPPPKRRVSDKDVLSEIFSSEGQHHATLRSPTAESITLHDFSLMKSLDDHKGRKEASYEEWMADLTRLYVGHRFASGAHSKLYQGVYKGQPVAVKMITLQPDDDERENGQMAARLERQFTREVTLLSHLYHRHVIKLIAASKQPPAFCVITEYLSGGSLRAFIHKPERKPLPLPKIIAIALEIARGMEYIHSQGVIHRDLKPDNIIFDQDLCVKIADFGIACEEAHCDASAEDPGTYRWMAPEMIRHKPYGHKVDVYSFGLVLWEMTTGRIPYEGKTAIQAAFAVVNKNLRPVVPPECPVALGALMEQCWSLRPEKRPDFWQVVKVLEQFESALDQNGTLDGVACMSCQDNNKNRFLQWIQKLKPHADGSVASTPRSSQPSTPRSSQPQTPRSSQPPTPRSSQPPTPKFLHAMPRLL